MATYNYHRDLHDDTKHAYVAAAMSEGLNRLLHQNEVDIPPAVISDAIRFFDTARAAYTPKLRKDHMDIVEISSAYCLLAQRIRPIKKPETREDLNHIIDGYATLMRKIEKKEPILLGEQQDVADLQTFFNRLAITSEEARYDEYMMRSNGENDDE